MLDEDSSEEDMRARVYNVRKASAKTGRTKAESFHRYSNGAVAFLTL